MSDKDEYCNSLEDCLERWSERIAELESAAEIAEGPTKTDCCNQIDLLKGIGRQMMSKLKEIKEAEGNEWKSLSVGAEKIKKELEKKISFPISRFR